MLLVNYEFIKGINTECAAIYGDRALNRRTYEDISELHNMPASEAKALYLKAKEIIKAGKYYWLDGLSNRAKRQIKMTEYTSFNELYEAIMEENVDLENLPKLGHKIAIEVREWCINKQKIN